MYPKLIILISLFILTYSCKNENGKFGTTLQQKISEIENFKNFDSFVTYYPDSILIKFYRNHPKGIYHPYQFLRDTAKTSDLIELLNHSHPFVKLYSFSALEKRNYENLYFKVLENLNDTAEFVVMSYDHGWYSRTCDMMIYYAGEKLNQEQKDTLKELILTDYEYIHTMEDILLYFKPVDKHYRKIKKLAQQENVFAKVALATYQRNEDVSTILDGFKNIEYHQGTFIYFKAIENFSHLDFLEHLIHYGENIEQISSEGEANRYFYNALAKYQNEEALRLFEKLSKEDFYNWKYAWYDAVVYICKALKKYECELYKPMIKELQTKIENVSDDYFSSTMYFYEDEYFDDNIWNY